MTTEKTVPLRTGIRPQSGRGAGLSVVTKLPSDHRSSVDPSVGAYVEPRRSKCIWIRGSCALALAPDVATMVKKSTIAKKGILIDDIAVSGRRPGGTGPAAAR